MGENRSTGAFLKGAASLSLAVILVKIIGVAYKIPLSYILGDEGMGHFNTAYTVYTFFFLICSAGVPKAITILINGSESQKSGEEATLIKTAVLAFSALAFVAMLAFGFSAFPIATVIGSSRSAAAMLALAPSIPFISVSAVYRGYLNGRMRFGVVAASQLLEAGLKLALGLLFAQLSSSNGLAKELVAAAAIFGITIASVIDAIFLFAISKSVKTHKNIRQKATFSSRHLRKILKISIPITLSSCVMSLVNVIDLTVIIRGLRSGGYSEELATILYGNYSTLAVPMFNFALAMLSSICLSALPILTEHYSKKREEEFLSTFSGAASLVGFIAMPATILFFTFSKEILYVLFEDSSVALGSVLLSFLSPSVLMLALLTLTNTALEARGGYAAPLISMGIGGVVKILVSSTVVTHTDLAIWGAPLGTAISYLVSLIISLSMFYAKDGSLRSIIGRFLPSAFASILAVIITVSLRSIIKFDVKNALASCVLLGIYALIYLALSLMLGTIPKNERKKLAKSTI